MRIDVVDDLGPPRGGHLFGTKPVVVAQHPNRGAGLLRRCQAGPLRPIDIAQGKRVGRSPRSM